MNLIGSRSALIANVCALIVAGAVTAEGSYIVHECLGYYRPQDTWAFFVPALIMFIIRSRVFSLGFLALYVALLIDVSYQARSIHIEASACGGRLDDPLGDMALFFFASLVCLAIYSVIAVVKFIISLVTSKERGEPWDRTP